jgi:alpha-L-fucosidase
MSTNATDALYVSGGPVQGPSDASRTAWIKRDKFGMFVHWGLYSIPAGIWQDEEVAFVGEWIMRWKKIPAEKYRKLADRFTAEKFNPQEWPALAEEAGMKYFVITAKHHDGFALFDSAADTYNCVQSAPFGRDPMPELANQCRAHGLRFGFYYSHDQDWNEPDASGNNWDFPAQGRDFSRYLQNKALPQVRELLTRYGPIALIWFDTPVSVTRTDAEELMELVHTLQPDCLTNGRLGHGLGDYEQMGDNEVPSNVYPRLWEVPATLNDTWGYKKNDHNWKSAGNLIYRLTDIVSKGGCYLLNIGPRADGSVPHESAEALRQVGAWLKINGKSIYGTDHSPFTIGDDSWRCTRKPGELYFHLLEWPGKTFVFRGLETPVTKVRLLGGSEAGLNVTQRDGCVEISGLPEQPPGRFHSVLAVELAEPEAHVRPERRWDAPRDLITLTARDCNPHGPGLCYSEAENSTSGFFEPSSRVRWQIVINCPGRFTVDLDCVCPSANLSDRFEFACDPKTAGEPACLSGALGSKTGTVRLGEIALTAPGLYRTSFRLLNGTLPGMKLKRIRLTRI